MCTDRYDKSLPVSKSLSQRWQRIAMCNGNGENSSITGFKGCVRWASTGTKVIKVFSPSSEMVIAETIHWSEFFHICVSINIVQFTVSIFKILCQYLM